VKDGRCESFEGHADRADVTVHTPDQVWVDIAAGRLDGTQAIADGRYTVEGDYLVLAKLPQWFPTRASGA
jgi:putative sterol carrier protein